MPEDGFQYKSEENSQNESKSDELIFRGRTHPCKGPDRPENKDQNLEVPTATIHTLNERRIKDRLVREKSFTRAIVVDEVEDGEEDGWEGSPCDQTRRVEEVREA